MSSVRREPWECNLFYEDGSHGRLEYWALGFFEACTLARQLTPDRSVRVIKAVIKLWKKEQPMSEVKARAVGTLVAALEFRTMQGALLDELDAIADLLQR